MADDAGFERKYGPALRALGASGRECPGGEVLLQYADGSGERAAAAEVDRHIRGCPACREVVQRLRQTGPVSDEEWNRIEGAMNRRAAPWRVPWKRRWVRVAAPAVAAAVVLAVVTTVQFNTRVAPAPDPVTRGAGVQLLEPAGRVESPRAFRWNAAPAATGYRLQVLRGNQELIDRTAGPPPFRLTEEQSGALPVEVPLRWRVLALDAGGQVIAESPWMDFVIAP